MVFNRGNAGVRCAVLSSPYLIDQSFLSDRESLIELGMVVTQGNHSELEALALNPHLPDKFYVHLLERTGYFAELDERNYMFMLYNLGENARLSTPYDDTFLDGWSDFTYHEVFKAAWQLSTSVPANQEWAYVLMSLLRKTQPPVNFENVEEVIERWRIDPTNDNEDDYYSPGNAFDLRSRLADLLKADEKLLNSPDLALRKSFYRRFSPWEFENWPDFLEKDGEAFVENAIENISLWESSTERRKLREVAWDCPDPYSSMSMPNMYRGRAEWLEKEHPEWFQLEDDE